MGGGAGGAVGFLLGGCLERRPAVLLLDTRVPRAIIVESGRTALRLFYSRKPVGG